MKKRILTPIAAIAIATTVYVSTSRSASESTAVRSGAATTKAVVPENDSSPFKDQGSRTGYSLGMTIGEDIKRKSLGLDTDAIAAGFKDALSGGNTLLTEEQRRETMASFQQQMIAKMTAERQVIADANKKAADAFLAANKNKDGVTVLPSGLQYKVISEGDGAQPRPTDQVTVNYKGTLIDGTEFDNSYKRGEPATFTLNEVIKAWTEAIPLMKSGARWELYVPAEMAYGESGAGSDIPPNAALIFEVELLSVKQG